MAIWLDIKDAPGYKISSDGQVQNSKTGRILKPQLNRPGGVGKVNINGKFKYVHRLVADAFFAVGVDKTSKVIHVDGDNSNNKVSNLKVI